MDSKVRLEFGDSENIGYDDDSFDLVTAAFGVRNFEHLDQGLSEMARVTRKGGTVIVLEFSKPTSSPFRQLYGFYSEYILPAFGRLLSKDESAYSYLPESVKAFPYGTSFLEHMKAAGLSELRCVPLTFGVASLYIGKK